MQQNKSEVDVNVLISLYHQKLSQLTNQVILLEAKLQTLTNDFSKEREDLLKENLDLQDEYDALTKSKKSEQ
jgi:hypothetical protein